MNKILAELNLDFLLVNSTNEYLVEYPTLNENARYTLTGFSGSTGDALITTNNIYLFVDGRYHTQADNEVKDGITVVKLGLNQRQDAEIAKIILRQANENSSFGIVAKKVSQNRLENFRKLLDTKDIEIKLLEKDYINDFTEQHNAMPQRVSYEPKIYKPNKPTFISNLEEVSYLTGLRDFSCDNTSKTWQTMFADTDGDYKLFNNNEEKTKFMKEYREELVVDKSTINSFDYSLIKNPVYITSEIKMLKAVKTDDEIESYKKAFENTDKAVMGIREFIENNDNLSEFDIAEQLRKEFMKYGAKSLSFNSIVAINKNSALAHYAKNEKNVILHDGDLVLIDCGAYYEDGLATDITRVFVKGRANNLQKKVYTTVLKAFLNCFNSDFKTGFEYDRKAHEILDNNIEGFTFSHGLGHGIGINVHEAPPALNTSEIAKTEIVNNMTFTIEPGLYNPNYLGVRLENSCYKKDGKIHSFVKMGYEGKLINYSILNEQEEEWLKDFTIL